MKFLTTLIECLTLCLVLSFQTLTATSSADSSTLFASLLPTSLNHPSQPLFNQNQNKLPSLPVTNDNQSRVLVSFPSISSSPLTPTVETKSVPTSYCAPYSGSVCKKHVVPAAFVYYNLTMVSFKEMPCHILIII